jgi:hypothetical protein
MLHPLSAPQRGEQWRLLSHWKGSRLYHLTPEIPGLLPLLFTFVSALSTCIQGLGHMVGWGCHEESDLSRFQVVQFPKDQEKVRLGVSLNQKGRVSLGS